MKNFLQKNFSSYIYYAYIIIQNNITYILKYKNRK